MANEGTHVWAGKIAELVEPLGTRDGFLFVKVKSGNVRRLALSTIEHRLSMFSLFDCQNDILSAKWPKTVRGKLQPGKWDNAKLAEDLMQACFQKGLYWGDATKRRSP